MGEEKRDEGPQTYWQRVWKRLKKRSLGMAALFVVALFCLVGIYAPLLASSKPIVVYYDGSWYFPLFRYLFYTGFYTKKIDLFFNLLMFTFPLFLLVFYLLRGHLRLRKIALILLASLHMALFLLFCAGIVRDPAANPKLNEERQQAIQQAIAATGRSPDPSWKFDLRYMNSYAKLNLLLRSKERIMQHQRLEQYQQPFRLAALARWADEKAISEKAELQGKGIAPSEIPSKKQLKKRALENASPEVLEKIGLMPTLYHRERDHREQRLKQLQEEIDRQKKEGESYRYALIQKNAIIDRQQWIVDESKKIEVDIMPLIRPFHWEDDAGGDQSLNQYVDWMELTRVNRKDLVAALIFGIRISLVVGITAVGLALAIGVPAGAFAGYYGGTFDILLSRLLEIWESLPTFFMLLLVVAVTQSKSIFLIIAVIGIFGWTGFSRYIRGEFFKQRNLSYVEACRASGFNDRYIIFSHILPNAFPPLLTLLPFAIMGAITSEAGLSFLGLGEEESCSWGVLMDEGRAAFPGESYLLWPPAILLTALLIAIALVGDALRDALDPKGL